MSDFDDGNGLEVPPKSPQSLRTRIAAVLHKHLLAVLDSDWITCRCDDYLSRFTVETYEQHVADAVIRELGLREERTATELVTDPYSGATWTREGGHRYVTEWTADE